MTMTEQMTNDLTFIEPITGRDGRELHVYQGFNDWTVGQLPEKSLEEAIVRECPRDSQSRFSDEEAFYTWQKKGGANGRTTYLGLDPETGEVNTNGWLGQEPFAGKEYQIKGADGKPTGLLAAGVDHTGFAATSAMTDTLAFRVYESAGSNGFSRPFVGAMIRHYIQQELELERWGERPHFAGIHSETNVTNLLSTNVHLNLYGEGKGFLPAMENPHPKANRRAFILPRTMFNQVAGINPASFAA